MTDDALDQSELVSIQFTDSDRKRVLVVADDLTFLKETAGLGFLPTHAQVRACASVLRRLLIDNLLNIGARTIAGGQSPKLSVKATDLDRALESAPFDRIMQAWAGGAITTTAGPAHRGIMLGMVTKKRLEGFGSPDDFLKVHPVPQLEEREMTLHELLKSTCFAISTTEWGDVRVSRAELIKFVANKDGGVHFDPVPSARRPANGSYRSGTKEHRDVIAVVLSEPLARVGHLSGVEYEILSIARCLGEAPITDYFIQAAKQLAPEGYEGDPMELSLKQTDGTWAPFKFDPAAGEEFTAAVPADSKNAHSARAAQR